MIKQNNHKKTLGNTWLLLTLEKQGKKTISQYGSHLELNDLHSWSKGALLKQFSQFCSYSRQQIILKNHLYPLKRIFFGQQKLTPKSSRGKCKKSKVLGRVALGEDPITLVVQLCTSTLLTSLCAGAWETRGRTWKPDIINSTKLVKFRTMDNYLTIIITIYIIIITIITIIRSIKMLFHP